MLTAMPDSDSRVVAELADVHKSYAEGGQSHEVLRGVDLSVRAGQLVSLLGRSGSGKSTLLHLLGAIDAPDHGRVRVVGQDLGALSERDRTLLRRRHIGFVFQAFHLIPVLTVAENVALPLELDGGLTAQQRSRIDRLLDRVGLSDRAATSPDRLSGGEQQRVALARALVRGPQLVLADEPTGNLDDDAAENVLDLLTELCRAEGAAVVMATHSMRCAERCDVVHRLDHGRLVPVTPERSVP
jgi:putative ABC transport system ATP-binding protein